MKEINNRRLFDLVRYMRSELHEDELITDEEYALLLDDSKSVNRLHTYDQARENFDRKIGKLKKENDDLNAQIIRLSQSQSVKQHKMCGRKVTYSDKSEAFCEARKRKMRAYCCPHCGEWHLTSKVVNR